MINKEIAPRTVTGGLDEVGWGAFAGPIISVIATYNDDTLYLMPPGVKDSKKTTEAQRESLFLPLCNLAVDVGIGHAWPTEIDTIGPKAALQLSYTRAIKDLTLPLPNLLIIDGNNDVTDWNGRKIVTPKADVKYMQVSAASIIAKHFRDRIMMELAHTHKSKLLPNYFWGSNKGYGTSDHIQSIIKYGLVPGIHRLAYCRRLENRCSIAK